MIRLRDKSGGVHGLAADVRFVEICNDAGHLAAVAYTDNFGIVKVASNGDPEFARYCSMFKVAPAVIKPYPSAI